MRALAVSVVLLSLISSITPADAGNKRMAKKVVAATSARTQKASPRDRSIGAPWRGRLLAPVQLAPDEAYHLRRPARTYGTRTTVELVRRAILYTREAYPNTHVLAVGDLSAPAGGWITEHASHQSGRDVDLGLFYTQQPAGYPASFVPATPETLDKPATWNLIASLARTATQEGGVQFIFLDQRLMNALYRWAHQQRVTPRQILEVQRVLRHVPYHTDHLHVRFKCRARDWRCR